MSNGIIVATGDNYCGQCNVSEWKNKGIEAVFAGDGYSLGLRPNGKIVALGNTFDEDEILAWGNITSVFTGDMYTVGLQADGTLKITSGGLNHLIYQKFNVELFNQKNIVDVSISLNHIG